MKNISVSGRIILMLVVSLVSLVIVGTFGLFEQRAEYDRFEFVFENSIPSVKVLEEAVQKAQQIQILVRDHAQTDNADEKKQLDAKVLDQKIEIEKLLAKYEKELIADDTDKEMTQVDIDSVKKYMSAVGEFLDKSNANNRAVITKALLDVGAYGTELTKALVDHQNYNWKLADGMRTDNAKDYRQAIWLEVTTIIAVVLITAILGFFVIRDIRSRLNQLSELMDRVNRSLDFTVRIPVLKRDELGTCANAFNNLLDRLQANLKSIATGARSVSAAANGMTTSAKEVATASFQQSEAASNMAATVEEMTVSINHVADRAKEANRVSAESGRLAISGGRIITKTAVDIEQVASSVNTAAEFIRGLEQHSQQVSSVVAVIKEVADQTNLLALNAAIEAARAGEQGRGFAVVADEVRKLAERTAASTQEISSTMDSMREEASKAVSSMEEVVGSVATGVDSAKEANTAIHEIGEGSTHAVTMVQEIAEAITEQGAATNNIAIQVERIAQMSEESSAAAGNSAQSAEELDRVAKEMEAIVSAYRL
ncbi:methyl-accepting chemotaxis protein [uncultured Propionivibrio sp.]|uniref:methyl-accepting chemotaxis protein n=1 Tax=uncultured Propionivibrio sp. TaxID=426737 RepID=UPI0029BFAF3D|nr:methyl-accepting chemotaxis protein [uncultured Propionivibrio sp.]